MTVYPTYRGGGVQSDDCVVQASEKSSDVEAWRIASANFQVGLGTPFFGADGDWPEDETEEEDKGYKITYV